MQEEASTLNGTTIERQTLTRKEAAEYLGIHENTLDRTPEIPRIRIGGKVLFRIITLDKYLADKEKKNEIIKKKVTDAENSPRVRA